MNEFQKIQLELLKHFINICERLDLNYYLVHGSALGAVKYKGFIPWDDDIDVAMLRKDYDLFVKEAQSLLPDYLFLQNAGSDEEFPKFMSRLQDLRTTWVNTDIQKRNIKMGVFIDIIALDGCPHQENLQKKFLNKRMHFFRVAELFMDHGTKGIHRGIRTNIIRVINNLTGIYKNSQKNVYNYERYCRTFDAAKSELLCESMEASAKAIFPKQWFGAGLNCEFEGLTVKVPSNYDEYLTQRYGDWRVDLPEEEKYGHHFASIKDFGKSYTEYR